MGVMGENEVNERLCCKLGLTFPSKIVVYVTVITALELPMVYRGIRAK